MTPTPTQHAVLRWMLAYPKLDIGWGGGAGWPQWSASWANEDARRHMVETMGALGECSDCIEGKTAPRWKPLPGQTPRLTRRTFAALLRRGWVEVYARRVIAPGSALAERNYYRISPAGRRAALTYRERAA